MKCQHGVDVFGRCAPCEEGAYLILISELRAELAALRAELQKVRSAAISGMDAATQHGHSLVQQAARLKAESNPDALESERAANALLTEQLQKAEAEVERLRADAERYRWLADKVLACDYGDNDKGCVGWHIRHCKGPAWIAGDSIDAAIDAAIARGKE